MAVKLLGLNGVPEAGLEFNVVEEERAARELAEKRRLKRKAWAANSAGQPSRSKVSCRHQPNVGQSP